MRTLIRNSYIPFLLLFCAVAAFPQKTTEKTTRFAPQDVEFPAVEGWKLGQKSAIPVEESGIWVNYDSPDRERMTVYVYKRDKTATDLGGIVKEEFDGAQDALKTAAGMGMYQNLKIVKSETVAVGGTQGKVKALHAIISFEAGGNRMNSELFVFPYKGHVAKLRISRPATVDPQAESYLRLLRAMDGLFAN